MASNKIVEYLMPKLAMAMNEGTVAQWLVKEGDYVGEGTPLAAIETEKVAYDVEAPGSGYFFSVVSEGETVKCGTVLAFFCSEPQNPKADAEHTASEPLLNNGPEMQETLVVTSSRIKASPLAKKLAKTFGIDLASLNGTGPGGRIVKRDVLLAHEITNDRKVSSYTARPNEASEHVLAKLPLSGLRKTIANRMVQSLQSTAQVSCHWESDITQLLAQRAELVAQEALLGTRVSVNAFLIRALVYAIRQVPIANANVINDEIVIHRDINVGMAISVPGTSDYDSGLMVGVLHNVETMGLVAIDQGLRGLIARVRSGDATPADLSGSTFTLSSTAGIAPPGLKTTPVLNQPNVALLGPSTPIERPMVKEGEIKICTMLPLSFTFDHRALDGEPAARFMSALNDVLEKPSLLLA